MEATLNLVLVLVELLDVFLVQLLGLLGAQEASGSEEMLSYTVQVTLTTSNLIVMI